MRVKRSLWSRIPWWTGMALLIAAMLVTGVLWWLADDHKREACAESGGQVVEIHNTGRIGAWACIGGVR